MLFSVKMHKHLRSLINSAFILLYDWFVSNRFSLNFIKKCVVPFNLTTCVNLDNIHVNNLLVYCILSKNFLGVHINYNLLWKMLTNIVCNKLSQCVAMLKTFSHLLLLNVHACSVLLYFLLITLLSMVLNVAVVHT